MKNPPSLEASGRFEMSLTASTPVIQDQGIEERVVWQRHELCHKGLAGSINVYKGFAKLNCANQQLCQLNSGYQMTNSRSWDED
ncbi:hypothetical protein DCAR_0624550 [Daucus carota subsp. sativus]|uniref:Uncharacterized protein n=1 Tax=Daucus carota subsp. sativus TaxID=79200 RepID=A0A161ZVM3_DAUCS|nr:hypothetical protein DCAR_0624550 [Daucus carota subsp. sativus]